MGIIILFITAIIWGSAFLFQKMGGDCVGPFAFTVYRSILGSLFLLGIMVTRRSMKFGKTELVGGTWCGLALFIPQSLQQIGIADTSPGTCAFLTANYALAVPLLGLFIKKRPNWYVWPGVALALIGTFLICLKGAGEFTLGQGESLTLLCAIFFAVQILVVDHYVIKPNVDVLALTCIQFFTCALFSAPFLLLPSEIAHINFADIKDASIAIIFCGFISSGIAYTLQNVGQKMVAPAIAGIILSLESVFGVFFGWLAWTCKWISSPEEMTLRRLSGYALVFIAITFVQLLDLKTNK